MMTTLVRRLKSNCGTCPWARSAAFSRAYRLHWGLARLNFLTEGWFMALSAKAMPSKKPSIFGVRWLAKLSRPHFGYEVWFDMTFVSGSNGSAETTRADSSPVDESLLQPLLKIAKTSTRMVLELERATPA